MSLTFPAFADFKPYIVRFGEPKYDFSKIIAVDYVNPTAPKEGALHLGEVGSFDSVNPFVVQGTCATGVMLYCHDSLMKRTNDEIFSLYALIAESVDVAKDFSYATFKINPKARFHDGTPILASDIKFTCDLLVEKGHPRFKQLFKKVKEIIILDSLTIKFVFNRDEIGRFDPELPMIIALIRPLSEKNIKTHPDFKMTGLAPLLGSGPYKIKTIESGRKIIYERAENYWAKELPVLKGMYNFKEISIEYLKNATSHFQQFLTGGFDIYFEADPNQWHTRYDVPAVADGQIKRVSYEHKKPVIVKTIAFNMRKPIFQNLKIRQALSLAFDFETLNKLVFFDALKRPKSLFENTYLAHQGPATEKEKELLKKFMPLIQKDIENGELPHYSLDQAYSPNATKGDGNQRDNLEKAHHLLENAGWKLKDGKRLNEKDELFTLEFLIKDPKLEKIALSFKRSCQMLGIDIKVRLVDNVQYEARTTNHDFDLIVHSWANSLCPGVEQGYYFSQKAADIPGTSNYIGVKDELLEGLAFEIVNATDKETLAAIVHNLDRMIMHKVIFIPLSYDNTAYFAYHARNIEFPEINPNIGMTIIEMGWGKENIGEKNLPTEQPPLMDRIFSWFKNFSIFQ